MPWEKNYSEPDVLDRAIAAFWSRGYEATSMSDLVAATGINRGSIYSAFTDKHTLFVRALKHYDKHHRSDFLGTLAAKLGPRDAILAMFQSAIDAAIEGGDRSGCLLVNTALELSAHDEEVEAVVRNSFEELEGFFCSMVEAGQEAGTVAVGRNADDTAKALLALFLGLRVLARSRPEKPVFTAISKQAAMLLD